MKNYLLLSSALTALIIPFFAVGGYFPQPPQSAPLLTQNDPALAEYMKKQYASATLPPLVAAPDHLPPLAKGKPGPYRVVALPAEFDATALNDNGAIVGTWDADEQDDQNKTAVWFKGKIRFLPTVAIKNSGPQNPSHGIGTVINNSFVVGGSSGYAGSGAVSFSFRDAALWDAAKQKITGRTIGHLPDLSLAAATALNDRGQAVGLSTAAVSYEDREDPTPDHSGPKEKANAFFWDGRRMRDLGRGAAHGINERGQVVGTQNGKIVLWQESEKRISGDGVGWAINNRGQILFDVPAKPFSYSEHADLHRAAVLYRGQTIRLDVLPGDTGGQAESLNDRGEIVGISNSSSVDPLGTGRAFLWRAGKMYDLNRFVSARSGWKLQEARSINNKGWIVGGGIWHGKTRSFLLIPK